MIVDVDASTSQVLKGIPTSMISLHPCPIEQGMAAQRAVRITTYLPSRRLGIPSRDVQFDMAVQD